MDLKQYIKESGFINAKTVKTWPIDERNVVILGPGQETKFTDPKTKEIKAKPQIPVSRTSDKTNHQWTLSDTAMKELSTEFGTYDTTKWVGGVVKLVVREFALGDTVSGVVMQRPDTKPQTGPY